MEILVFESFNRTVIFEPEEEQKLTSEFIVCKYGCNSRYLNTGNFPEFSYNENLCRKPTEEEIKYYIQLKDHSKYGHE